VAVEAPHFLLAEMLFKNLIPYPKFNLSCLADIFISL
jgi:hypothetical protein